MERHICSIADTRIDRLGELNQYTGDGAKQKIKTVPIILPSNLPKGILNDYNR